jgi:8-oxo-dGTP pyrophosphatase MutT (NUDIX family)
VGLVPLSTYVGQDASEEADLVRVRRLLLESGDPYDRGLAMHITGSALIVHPPTERVLLRWHPKQLAWLQVGGHVDPGEDPLAAAFREGAEETGLTDLRPLPGPAVLHVVVVPVPASPKEPAHDHADVRYALATDRPESARPEHPGAPLRWLSLDEAQALTTEDNLRESLRRVRERLIRARG